MLTDRQIAAIGEQLTTGASWADIEGIHRTFAWLRDNSPVHFTEAGRFPA